MHWGCIVYTPGHTYRAAEAKPEDDQFRVNLEIQMADSVINTANSLHPIQIGAKIGGMLLSTSEDARVIRDNSEFPDLELTADVNSTINTG